MSRSEYREWCWHRFCAWSMPLKSKPNDAFGIGRVTGAKPSLRQNPPVTAPCRLIDGPTDQPRVLENLPSLRDESIYLRIWIASTHDLTAGHASRIRARDRVCDPIRDVDSADWLMWVSKAPAQEHDGSSEQRSLNETLRVQNGRHGPDARRLDRTKGSRGGGVTSQLAGGTEMRPEPFVAWPGRSTRSGHGHAHGRRVSLVTSALVRGPTQASQPRRVAPSGRSGRTPPVADDAGWGSRSLVQIGCPALFRPGRSG
jgi:hypothetical protein